MKVEEDKFSFSSFGDGGELDCSVYFKIEFKKFRHCDRRFDSAIRLFTLLLRFLDSGVWLI